MKTRAITPALLLAAMLYTGTAAAGDAIEHSGQASVHSASAVGELAIAGAKFVTGAAAVPLMASGAVGTLSAEAGAAMWQSAGGRIGAALPVTGDTYVTTPSPREAMSE